MDFKLINFINSLQSILVQRSIAELVAFAKPFKNLPNASVFQNAQKKLIHVVKYVPTEMKPGPVIVKSIVKDACVIPKMSHVWNQNSLTFISTTMVNAKPCK